MNFLFALIIGLCVGLHNATWGMYKDSPYEGFSLFSYLRSVVAGLVYGPLLTYLFQLDLGIWSNMFLLFGATYSLERITMEAHKSFVRVEDQGKYFIPMQLSAFGKPVENYALRLFFGLLYMLTLVAIAYGVHKLNVKYHNGNLAWSPFLIILVCSVFGWVSAVGGAWKDAPLEGFETFKFFRSPVIAYFFAFVSSLFTSNLLLITMSSIGFTIASIETYKTFGYRDNSPGKFKGKPVTHPEMMTKRKKFIPLFFLIWLLVLVSFIFGLTNSTDALISI